MIYTWSTSCSRSTALCTCVYCRSFSNGHSHRRSCHELSIFSIASLVQVWNHDLLHLAGLSWDHGSVDHETRPLLAAVRTYNAGGEQTDMELMTRNYTRYLSYLPLIVKHSNRKKTRAVSDRDYISNKTPSQGAVRLCKIKQTPPTGSGGTVNMHSS